MLKHWPIVLVCLAVAGCATTPRVGTAKWHDTRLAEIEAAYEASELEEDEYLERKNEADEIRSEYLERREERRSRVQYSIGIGYGYNHFGGHYRHHGHHYGHGHHH